MAPRILVLVRHADASHSAMRDEDRPLTGVGRVRARELGALLAARIGAADLALVSPATRAAQSADGIAENLEIARTAPERSLYTSGAGELLAIASALEGTVVLVGHEPTISEAGWLLGDDDAREDLRRGVPTATALVVEIPAGTIGLEGARLPVERITAPRRP
ncbi:SixA phosphatase family protein [Actinomyces culturomici]|uniref:SixA phosphatase family protein n=1 Tax=Actinomyces culturomici TaxID=1926276 RepID=UPI000E1FC927|nr:histidine phosphatase family protein [Actinomyces culturomici]